MVQAYLENIFTLFAALTPVGDWFPQAHQHRCASEIHVAKIYCCMTENTVQQTLQTLANEHLITDTMFRGCW